MPLVILYFCKLSMNLKIPVSIISFADDTLVLIEHTN